MRSSLKFGNVEEGIPAVCRFGEGGRGFRSPPRVSYMKNTLFRGYPFSTPPGSPLPPSVLKNVYDLPPPGTGQPTVVVVVTCPPAALSGAIVSPPQRASETGTMLFVAAVSCHKTIGVGVVGE